jgi:hypothetical protein
MSEMVKYRKITRPPEARPCTCRIEGSVVIYGNPCPRHSVPRTSEATPGLVRCWRCKHDVPEETTVCNAGIGTQCKDAKACRGRWYSAPEQRRPTATTLPSGAYREQSLRLRKLALDFLNSEERVDEVGHDHISALTHLLRTVEDAERQRRESDPFGRPPPEEWQRLVEENAKLRRVAEAAGLAAHRWRHNQLRPAGISVVADSAISQELDALVREVDALDAAHCASKTSGPNSESRSPEERAAEDGPSTGSQSGLVEPPGSASSTTSAPSSGPASDEQRARECLRGTLGAAPWPEEVADVAALLAEVRAEEREACAREVETYGEQCRRSADISYSSGEWSQAATHIAKTLRSAKATDPR